MSRTNRSNKLVRGIGIKGNDYPSWDGSGLLREYKAWSSMIKRCSSQCWNAQPCYIGVTCSENFKSYSYFYEWCQTQIGFNSLDSKGKVWQLDKDLLVRDNKEYNENVFVFIPRDINCLLTKSNASRGEFPIGVHFCNREKLFAASCNKGSKIQKWLGYYKTPQEAFQAYKDFKEAVIKKVAEDYKNQVDPRVYEVLMKYEVSEND